MGIDQSWKDGCVGQLDPERVGRNFRVGGWTAADDLSVLDKEDLIGERFAGLDIEQMSGVDSYGLGCLGNSRQCKTQNEKYEQDSDSSHSLIPFACN
jgi:hypothetical protein